MVTVMLPETAPFEKHYRIGDLARTWGLGRETVRKLVKDDPGVIKIRTGSKEGAHGLQRARVRGQTNPHAIAQRGVSCRCPEKATSFGFGLPSNASFKIFVSRA